ncbi:sporulation protein [Saccharopolyspora hordei]|uniref:Sporulation-control protein n=1 Tax=Saccharopolyspora hordei TaxID=1838 RepID=A0A853AJM2_9PSEU|nr:sporulation protein [Saccharopolyspora hordei]NYI84854.1 sporulation-control protein [Saccharopolyspora hordei]
MVFKKLLGALGIGAPSVDTVLHQPTAHPGAALTGEVRITAGKQDITVEHVALRFAAHVETVDGPVAVEFHRAEVSGPRRLSGGQQDVVPFEVVLPWTTPISTVHGMVLDGVTLGVHTELGITGNSDATDLDPLAVEPLPAQLAVLDALGQLGLQFHGTGVRPGGEQEPPTVQEIEFFPPPQFAGRLNDVWLAFTADADGLGVVLEADKRSGIPTPGGDDLGRFRVGHGETSSTDWIGRVQDWLEQVAERRAGLGTAHGHLDGRGGSGIGGAVAGAALGAGAGLLGGMVLGEVLDEDDEF